MIDVTKTALEEFRMKAFGRFSTTTMDGNNGAFILKRKGIFLLCLVSDGGGWDHVSVSLRDKRNMIIKRCPTWEEMSFVKNLFFAADEVVYQLHVAKGNHINIHNYCLHLWRNQGEEIALPPVEFV